ncbi:MAG: hypothetical protein WA133_06625 [Syntrophales bacterium]
MIRSTVFYLKCALYTTFRIFKEGEQHYGFLPDTVRTAEERLQISRFFFWTAWVASAPRLGGDASYTNNWPPDKSIGNVPAPSVMLSIALLLFSWRGLVKKERWHDGVLKLSFCGLNGGLFLMSIGTLLPVGVIQGWVSFQDGLWAARDASFFEQGTVLLLGTLRIIPDLIIIVLGVLPLTYFLFTTYPHLKAIAVKDGESVWERLGIKL